MANSSIAPDQIIPADNDFHSINMAGFENTVWATAPGGLLRIDASTGNARFIPYSEPAGDSRALTAGHGAIWVTDFYNHTAHRIDPATGRITSTTSLPGEPRAALVGEEEMWIPINGGGTHRVDPDTAKIMPPEIEFQASAYGLSSLWVGQEDGGDVLRVDPATGDVLDTIDTPEGGSGCRVGGSFPESVWGWCGLVHETPVVTRLDPEDGSVVDSVDLGGMTSSARGLLTIDDGAWFPLIPSGPGESGMLVRVNLETNEVDRVFDGGPKFDVNELVVAGGSLWASMEIAQEVWRFSLEQLEAVP